MEKTNFKDYKVIIDYKIDKEKAIQKAIDKCFNKGGG